VFFSLDAGNSLHWHARVWFNLPYFRARMICEEKIAGSLQSERTHRETPSALLEEDIAQ